MSGPFPVGARVVDRSDPVTPGTVTDSPAVDPDGAVWPCHVVVQWDDDAVEVVATADLIRLEQEDSPK
jgi:hypothetical protein